MCIRDRCGCEYGKEVQLEGPQLGKGFVLRMLGPMEAARLARIRHCQSALRLGSGQWRSFAIWAPGGRSIPVYVGCDKGRRDLARERACRALRNAL
eukprot:3771943-Pyramimonas_sp.AAC.1